MTAGKPFGQLMSQLLSILRPCPLHAMFGRKVRYAYLSIHAANPKIPFELLCQSLSSKPTIVEQYLVSPRTHLLSRHQRQELAAFTPTATQHLSIACKAFEAACATARATACSALTLWRRRSGPFDLFGDGGKRVIVGMGLGVGGLGRDRWGAIGFGGGGGGTATG